MNRSFIVAVLTVTMIIMMSTAGYAIVAPHSLACDNCHGKFSSGPDRPANAASSCVACHSSMGEAARMPVNTDAMSNFFGSAAGQPSTGSRSTHTWGAVSPSGPVNSSPAKVVDSTNPILASGYNYGSGTVPLSNSTACVRCHNAKSNSNTAGVNKPFLRLFNAGDALCLECHSLRNVTNQAFGSHPVAYRAYSTVYKSNTTAFRRVPLSPNPNNPTAKLGNYLSSGKIVCTTCHAPHYADSSSATLDNRSTANGFAADDPAKGLKGSLQNSRGQLLRTDPIGSSASAINVCSSCHKETKNLNHNAKGQNVQCDHCHAAHVDYNSDGSAPNLYLVRRNFSNVSISTGKLAAGKKAIFNTSSSGFMRNDGKGICQVCHTPTPGVAIHDQLDTKKEDCLACHKHSDGFTASACDTCHGQPPVQGKAAAGYTIDEAFTPHATHADAAYYKYACKNCHYSGTRTDSHNTLVKSYQSVFIDTAGSVGDQPGLTKNIPAHYDSTNRTCSVVYCHSNGNPRGGSISWKSATTPSWVNGKNKILNTPSECITCHDSGSTLNTNAHYKHVTTTAIKCYVCHYATVTDSSSIKDRTKHANGTKDVVFINQPPNYIGGAFSASFNTSDATCTNSCHTNGQGVHPVTPAKWTDPSTGACGTCHAAVPASNAHTFHFSDPIGPQLGTAPAVCSNCHIYAAGSTTHANGVADLKAASCAPCHPGSSPTWFTGSKVTCESCHTGVASVVGSYTAPLKSLNKTLGHGQYSTAILTKVKCTTCHNPTAPHIGAGASQNIANVRSNACAGCHDTHGTTNRHSIKATINGQVISFTSSTGLYVSTKNANNFYSGLCQVCHTKTKYYRNYTTPATHYTSNCFGCHQHKGAAVMFAFQPVGGGCGGCHGYPPVKDMAGRGVAGNYSSAKFQDYSGGGGAHTVAGHIAPTARQSDAWTNCSNCHYNTTHNTGGAPAKKAFVNVIVNPQFKFDSATPITYNASTCSNVSCHFQPSPNWTTGQ
jgi:predicted CxxxxCH...CXXCH cytochrome family protein